MKHRNSALPSGLALVSLLLVASGACAAPPAPVKGRTQPPKPAVTNHSAALNAYWGRLQPRVTNNWVVPDGKNHVVITVNVQPDGSVGDFAIVSTPKDGLAEQSCSEAFTKSQPLEALPSGMQGAKLVLTFDYNYDPHGDGSSKLYGSIAPINISAPAQAQQPAQEAQSDSTSK